MSVHPMPIRPTKAINQLLLSPQNRNALRRLSNEGPMYLTGRFFGRKGDGRDKLIPAPVAGRLTRACLARIESTGWDYRSFVLSATPLGKLLGTIHPAS
jgi:hypothetical protein